MKRVFIWSAVAVLLVSSFGMARAQDRNAPRCCAHMCPVAKASTNVGYDVVRRQASHRVEAAELLS